jgi:hypothetical protein
MIVDVDGTILAHRSRRAGPGIVMAEVTPRSANPIAIGEQSEFFIPSERPYIDELFFLPDNRDYFFRHSQPRAKERAK